jgi:hypothetical protein
VVDPTAEDPLLLVYPEKGQLKKKVLLGSAKQPGILPRALALLEQQPQQEIEQPKKQSKRAARGKMQQQEGGEEAAVDGAGSDVDFLPAGVLEKHKLLGLAKAFQELHQPSSLQLFNEAQKRLAFQVRNKNSIEAPQHLLRSCQAPGFWLCLACAACCHMPG